MPRSEDSIRNCVEITLFLSSVHGIVKHKKSQGAFKRSGPQRTLWRRTVSHTTVILSPFCSVYLSLLLPLKAHWHKERPSQKKHLAIPERPPEKKHKAIPERPPQKTSFLWLSLISFPNYRYKILVLLWLWACIKNDSNFI